MESKRRTYGIPTKTDTVPLKPINALVAHWLENENNTLAGLTRKLRVNGWNPPSDTLSHDLTYLHRKLGIKTDGKTYFRKWVDFDFADILLVTINQVDQWQFPPLHAYYMKLIFPEDWPKAIENFYERAVAGEEVAKIAKEHNIKPRTMREYLLAWIKKNNKPMIVQARVLRRAV